MKKQRKKKFGKNKLTIIVFIALITVFATIIILGQDASIGQASILNSGEARHFSTASIDDRFADDRVIVTFNKEISFRFSDVSIEDFPELRAKSVRILNYYVRTIVRNQIEMEVLGRACITERLIDSYIFRKTVVIKLYENCKQGVLDAIRILKQRPDIISATPSYFLSRRSRPDDPGFNDPNFSDNFPLMLNESGTAQWGLDGEHGIGAPSAWSIVTGNGQGHDNEVIVGVIDTGIRATHEDLVNRVDVGLSRDFTQDDPNVSEITYSDGHGTHVAGIIGAEGNNGIGITGVCWNVTLVSLRVAVICYDNDVEIWPFDYIIDAIDFATGTFLTDRPIRILNFSGGIYITEVQRFRLREAILAFPGLFVTAANNANVDHDVVIDFPTDFHRDPDIVNGRNNVISVSSINWHGQRVNNRAWGRQSVGIFAPGEDILSTYHRNDTNYARWDGTSMATPHVSGVAALMLSVNPSLTPAQLKSIIINSGTPFNVNVPTGHTSYVGRKLNAYRAVKNAAFTFDTRMANNNAPIRAREGAVLEGDIPIPSSIIVGENTRAVNHIVENGFAESNLLESVRIPRSVTTVGANAFPVDVDIYWGDNVAWGHNFNFRTCTGSVGLSFMNTPALTPHHVPRNVAVTGFTTPQGFGGTVIIPEGVTEIDARAFYGQSNIIYIYIPRSVLTIGANAFPIGARVYWDNNFNYVVCQESVGLSFVTRAVTGFAPPSNFNGTITIPEGVRDVFSGAFQWNSNVRVINVPSSVWAIASNAFPTNVDVSWSGNFDFRTCIGSVGLAFGGTRVSSFETPQDFNGTVRIPYGVARIGDRAFQGNTQIVSVHIPRSVISIENNSFSNATSLRTISMPYTWQNWYNNIPLISNNNFVGVNRANITLVIPQGSRQSYLDRGWTGFNTLSVQNTLSLQNNRITEFQAVVGFGGELIIPSGFVRDGIIQDAITQIAPNVFRENPNLTSVFIPRSVISIENNVFSINTTVEWESRFRFRGNTFLECLRSWYIRKVEIPSYIAGRAITHIADGAFAKQHFIQELIIPESITAIGDYAFSHMMGLSVIRSNMLFPPQINELVFYGVNKTFIAVYIPIRTRQVYEMTGWGNFTLIELTDWTLTAISIVYRDCNGYLEFDGQYNNHTYGIRTILPNPSRVGYIFSGWFLCSSLSGQRMFTLTNEHFNNALLCWYNGNFGWHIGLYAKWVSNDGLLLFDGGSGTFYDPTRIGSAFQLRHFAYLVNEDFYLDGIRFGDMYFVLTRNIYLNNELWTPIGNLCSPFSGVFDGNGFIVYNIYINNYDDNNGLFGSHLGLFGFVSFATIKNLGVRYSFIQGGWYIGGIAGGIYQTHILNVFNEGGQVRGVHSIGGLVGVMHGNPVNSPPPPNLYNSMIINSFNTSLVQGSQRIGGLVGVMVSNNRIFNSFNTGAVEGWQSIGGIVGIIVSNFNVIINNYNTGEIDRLIGGFNGSNVPRPPVLSFAGAPHFFGGGIVGAIWPTTPNNFGNIIMNNYSSALTYATQIRGGIVGGVVSGAHTIVHNYFAGFGINSTMNAVGTGAPNTSNHSFTQIGVISAGGFGNTQQLLHALNNGIGFAQNIMSMMWGGNRPLRVQLISWVGITQPMVFPVHHLCQFGNCDCCCWCDCCCYCDCWNERGGTVDAVNITAYNKVIDIMDKVLDNQPAPSELFLFLLDGLIEFFKTHLVKLQTMYDIGYLGFDSASCINYATNDTQTQYLLYSNQYQSLNESSMGESVSYIQLCPVDFARHKVYLQNMLEDLQAQRQRLVVSCLYS